MDQYSFCSFPFPISLENNSKTTPCRLSQTAALSLIIKLEALKKTEVLQKCIPPRSGYCCFAGDFITVEIV